MRVKRFDPEGCSRTLRATRRSNICTEYQRNSVAIKVFLYLERGLGTDNPAIMDTQIVRTWNGTHRRKRVRRDRLSIR